MERDSSGSVLEQFRQQWKEEVSARTSQGGKQRLKDYDTSEPDPDPSSDSSVPIRKATVPPPQIQPLIGISTDSQVERSQEDDLSGLTREVDRVAVSNTDDDDDDGFTTSIAKEPESALEHYERAVQKEYQGNLGVSLSHYRKAYRLDASVDQSYKHKHFPPISASRQPSLPSAPTIVPSNARQPSRDTREHIPLLNLAQNFAGSPILGQPPCITGDRPSPCPISRLPSELLAKILMEMAIYDPALFSRLALVCKRLAYHVCVENQIWKRIALGTEFGLASNLHDFKTDLQGREIINQSLSTLDAEQGTGGPILDRFEEQGSQDWREVFHHHPRIRYTGVYISTVNYTRAGGTSTSQATWSSPVHIVTYYRYLRFFRDGTMISLLSTNEPIEVVHQLTKQNVSLARGGKEHHPLNFTSSTPATNGPPGSGAPTTIHQLMKYALRGRWYLGHPQATEQCDVSDSTSAHGDPDSNVYIETEGAGPRYLYTMQLALTSSRKSQHGVKNNKLQWKSFWSYNHLTNDWAPFQLKNDKPFFFSRVRSYGLWG